MNRRGFLLGVGAVLAGPGCFGPTETSPNPVTQTGPEQTPRWRSKSKPTPEPVAETGPDSYLPESTDRWEFRGRSDYVWSPLGANDGTIGHYTGPDGNAYEFVVIDTDSTYAESSARSLACAGWQIAIVIDTNAIASSTGTEQRTFTPEVPPTMTQSPIPDTESRVRELLALSPRLTDTDVTEHQIECNR